jgi:hypothetical protein
MAPAGGCASPPGLRPAFDVQTVKFGINYRFGWGGEAAEPPTRAAEIVHHNVDVLIVAAGHD